MNDIAIQVENLSKSYRIGSNQSGKQQFGYVSLRDVLSSTIETPLRRAKALLKGQSYAESEAGETIWALRDVSFEVKPGEVVGIIGRNGAGKSTLLKILTRITEPSRGEAKIYGRIGSLLEVGTGFHPELTGRENIYLNGAILGMKRAEITRKFDEIVDFAEIETFIDTPVKHYSSGMYMRLAFSVAAHLEPDILLVDEVLAVGDAQFQKKCLGKMGDAAQSGRTVLLVSHNMAAISGLCNRTIYLKDGKIHADGPSQETISQYMIDFESHSGMSISMREDREGEGHVRFTNVRWLDAQTLSPLSVVGCGQEVYLEVSYETAPTYEKPIREMRVKINILTPLQQFVTTLDSSIAGGAFAQQLPPRGQLFCHIERFPLMPGRYLANVLLKVNGVSADVVRNACSIDVEKGDFYGTGITRRQEKHGVFVPQQWQVEPPHL